jgi:uncharacterized membrane protein YqgA involved in biofilm formation
MNRKFGALTSSTNPEELADRVKGIILASSSIIIFFAAQFFHIQLSANDIVSLSTEAGALIGAIWTIYGAIKAVVAYFSKTA